MAKAQKTTKTETGSEVEVVGSALTVQRQRSVFHLLGTSPLIYHRMALKAQRELLLPRGRMTAADKAVNLKHSPLQEFRDSVYMRKEDLPGKTRLVFPGEAFHRAIANAAMDMPGMKKSQIGRLCGVEEFDISIYGIPQIYLAVVRNSDINRTPDIRSRAIVPQWACEVTVWFTRPLVRQNSITDLMVAAGIYIGIGDNRQQKGAGSFGLWDVVNHDDPQYVALVKNCTAKAQDVAIKNPAPFNEETAELLTWFDSEMKRREDQPTVARRSKSSNGPAAEVQA